MEVCFKRQQYRFYCRKSRTTKVILALKGLHGLSQFLIQLQLVVLNQSFQKQFFSVQTIC